MKKAMTKRSNGTMFIQRDVGSCDDIINNSVKCTLFVYFSEKLYSS